MKFGVSSGNWKRSTLGLSIFMLAIVLGGCTADKKPSKVETTLANMAKDVVIPIEVENEINPLRVNKGTSNEGRRLYLQSCAVCHGVDGHGRTELGQSMYPPAMDLTSPHVQHWNDAELFWIIQNGVRLTGMPSWKSTISERDMWKLVNFIRNMLRMETELPPITDPPRKTEHQRAPETLIAYGKTLYRQEGCFVCHRLNEEGGKVGPDLISANLMLVWL